MAVAELPEDLPDASGSGISMCGEEEMASWTHKHKQNRCKPSKVFWTLCCRCGCHSGHGQAFVHLPGLLAKISGLDRSVVSRHLSEHLRGEDACIWRVGNQGGWGGKKRKYLELPTGLPEIVTVETENAEASLLEPLLHKYPYHSYDPVWVD